ncbi:hypothetical protein J5Y09_23540 [Roseomonas sp. PWR1]|uniref:Uncharacterized protein n=1 Tax=Roseomonas nitratireducens TaxID=2820810 RepID=A0ABS4AZX4_9PROT|nr:hypothetical protein [Neoroseomonas nitratireducens]MBP0466922.1 hypothetical protein [Neoroseomonas nitratireducens]
MDPMSRNEIAEAAETAIRRHVALTDRPLDELRLLATQLAEAIESAIRHAAGDRDTHENVREIILGAIARLWAEHGGEAEAIADIISLADLDR